MPKRNDPKTMIPGQIYPSRKGTEAVRKPQNVPGQNRKGLGNPQGGTTKQTRN